MYPEKLDEPFNSVKSVTELYSVYIFMSILH